MALNYDVTKVKDAWFKVDERTLQDEAKEKAQNPNRISMFSPTRYVEDGDVYQMESILQTVIFLSMNVGMDKITEKNKTKFFNRIKFIEGGKPIMRLNGEPHPFTQEMVNQCVGLTTNASTMTKSQFIKAQTQFLEL